MGRELGRDMGRDWGETWSGGGGGFKMYLFSQQLKTGYMGFARLESSALHSAIVNPAVAMAAEVHRQRPPAGAQWLHICTMPIAE